MVDGCIYGGAAAFRGPPLQNAPNALWDNLMVEVLSFRLPIGFRRGPGVGSPEDQIVQRCITLGPRCKESSEVRESPLTLSNTRSKTDAAPIEFARVTAKFARLTLVRPTLSCF